LRDAHIDYRQYALDEWPAATHSWVVAGAQ
jgi:hypothetical protein